MLKNWILTEVAKYNTNVWYWIFYLLPISFVWINSADLKKIHSNNSDGAVG